MHARIARIDNEHAALVARRAAFEKDEHAMADQVAAVAARAKAAEDRLYGGSVTAAKDLSALQSEIASIRVQQEALEEQEMSLLEEVEQTETEMAKNRATRGGAEVDLAEIDARIAQAEGVIDAELSGYEREKSGHAEGLPVKIMNKYESLRSSERLGGIAAAAFTEKGCGGCKMQLPRLEVSRMREEPEDALLQCENCGRMLVR